MLNKYAQEEKELSLREYALRRIEEEKIIIEEEKVEELKKKIQNVFD